MGKKGDPPKEDPPKKAWQHRKGGTGGNTPPQDGKSTASRKTCGNSHVANSEGKCFTAGCAYYVRG